jgi:hypothetical protein
MRRLPLALLLGGCLLEFDERLVQLDVVCERPGVIRCYGFDDPMDLEARIGMQDDPACEDGACTQIVTDEIVSGTGAVRFEIASGSEGPPLFFLNFADDLSRHVGEGEHLYVQWRQRMSAEMLREFAGLDEGRPYWLQVQVGEGDRSDGTITDRCTTTDVAVAQNTRYMGPMMWIGCAGGMLLLEEVVEGTSEILLQNGEDAQCLYSDPTVPPCIAYEPDRWTAYQIHVEPGTWQESTTRVRMWMTDPGQRRRMVFDSEQLTVAADPGDAYGKIWIGPSMYNRDASEQHAPAYTWYDNLVISTEEIPDPEL